MSSQLIQGKNLFFKEEQKESFFPTFILNVDSKSRFHLKKEATDGSIVLIYRVSQHVWYRTPCPFTTLPKMNL